MRKIFAKNLKELRKEHNLTQEDLGIFLELQESWFHITKLGAASHPFRY